MRPPVPSHRVPRLVVVFTLSSSVLLGAGCGVGPTTVSPIASGSSINGRVHGGQQPVSGSKVYLYAASNSGYSAPATSLLGGAGYVTTDSGGSFSITVTYTCPAGAYVYLLALGGNPGLAPGTNNPDLALMTGIGSCSALLPSTFIPVNEVTTVATAYSLAQFMSSETLVGTSSTNAIGMQNAFATMNNLISTPQGFALATTPAGNGVVPQAEINSLANALAACVNSDGTGAPCSTLMSAANVTGAGGTPVDTIQAAINIAQNPGTNVAAIYGIATPSAAFQPVLSAAPSDWTMSIVYSGGGIQRAQEAGVAVDAVGNIWATNFHGGSVVELSPLGAFVSPGSGYSNGVPGATTNGLGLDLSGNVWVASYNFYISQNPPGSIQKFSTNGSLLSGSAGFVNSCLSGPAGIVVDPTNNVWTADANGLCKLNSAGTFLSPQAGYKGGNLPNSASAIVSDAGGNIWVNGSTFAFSGGVGMYSWALAEFDPSGNPLSPATGFQTGGGNFGTGLAIDHSGNVWAGSAVFSNNALISGSISKFSSTGTLLSPSVGYVTPHSEWLAVDGVGRVWANDAYPSGNSALSELANDGTLLSPVGGYAVPGGGFSGAIDGSGNLWEGNNSIIVESIGIAAPVVTPIAKAVATNSLGIRP